MTQQPTDPFRAFAELVNVKLGDLDFDGVCERAADLARRIVADAEDASIVVVRDEQARTAAATSDRVRLVDETGGAALHAAAGITTIRVGDTRLEKRWPRWAASAADAGFRSVLAVGLSIHATASGALVLYGATPGAFDEAAVDRAQAFANYAAVAMSNADLYDTTAGYAEDMRRAMQHRAVIEQAKGIIMGERRCSADEAFVILTKLSQTTNRKVRDVAAALVARSTSPTGLRPNPDDAHR